MKQFVISDDFDDQLQLECSLADYRLTEVAIFPVSSRGVPSSSNASMSSRSVSTSDILRLQQQNQSHPNVVPSLANQSYIENTEHRRREANTRLVRYVTL